MEFVQNFTKLPMELWITSLILIVFYVVRKSVFKQGKLYPPGPIGLPIVGYIPFLGKEPHVKLNDLTKKYGNIYSLYLGDKYSVVLGDVKTVRDTLNQHVFHGRPPRSTLNPKHFPLNISSVNNKDWLEQRNFVFYALKGLGKGKTLMEDIIEDEIHYFMKALEMSNCQPTNISETLTSSVSNVITKLLFGERLEHGSDGRIFLDKCVQGIVEYSVQTHYQGHMSWIEGLPLVRRYLKTDVFWPLMKEMRKVIIEQIEEHKNTFDPDNIRDYIDAFLLQIKNDKENNIASSFSEEMLIGTIYTMFGAGSETVRTSIDWTLYVMMAHPEVQKKIQSEIDDVIGKERMPTSLDQKLMPYTMSVIMEVQRFYTIIPINIVRYTMADSKIGGYHIPKNTTIIANIWAIHHDPTYWKNPEVFLPERFWDKDGKGMLKTDSYMPFSYGKRLCPGESVAMIEIFLFLTRVLQKFDICLPDGASAELEALVFVSNQPKPHDMCFIPRV